LQIKNPAFANRNIILQNATQPRRPHRLLGHRRTPGQWRSFIRGNPRRRHDHFDRRRDPWWDLCRNRTRRRGSGWGWINRLHIL